MVGKLGSMGKSYNQRIAIPLPPVELLNERFYIDGPDLRIKTRYCNNVQVGSIAGSPLSSGYRHVRINGKRYYVHRLVWKMVHHTDPTETVDHIDRNPANNAPENLRVATQSEQLANSSIHRGSGKGYYWNKALSKWQSHVRVGGRLIHLGHYKTEDFAAAARFLALRYIDAGLDVWEYRAHIRSVFGCKTGW